MNNSRKSISERMHILETGSEVDSRRSEQLNDKTTRFDTLTNLSVDSTLPGCALNDLTQLRLQLERMNNDYGLCRNRDVKVAANRITTAPSIELSFICAQHQENKQ